MAVCLQLLEEDTPDDWVSKSEDSEGDDEREKDLDCGKGVDSVEATWEAAAVGQRHNAQEEDIPDSTEGTDLRVHTEELVGASQREVACLFVLVEEEAAVDSTVMR